MRANYDVFIQFSDEDIMEYTYERYTEGEAIEGAFRDAVIEGMGATIEYIKIKLSADQSGYY